MRLILTILLCAWSGPAAALGEYIVPIAAPIIRDADADFDPLCGALRIFEPEGSDKWLLDPDVLTRIYDLRDSEDAGSIGIISTTNLARKNKIETSFFDRKHWRVVSFRAELCEQQTPPCEPEFRIVAQPVQQAGIFVNFGDHALHLVYRLRDPATYYEKAERLAGLTVMLRPSAEAAFAKVCRSSLPQRIAELLKRFAPPADLLRVAWMVSSASGQEWTFGQFTVGANMELIPGSLRDGGYFDNFDKVALLRGECPLNQDSSDPEKALFGCGGEHDQETTLLELLHDPHSLLRPQDRCVACHAVSAGETIYRLGRRSDDNGVPLFAAHGVDVSNLRQFGYSLRGIPTISDRVRMLSARPR